MRSDVLKRFKELGMAEWASAKDSAFGAIANGGRFDVRSRERGYMDRASAWT